MSPRKIKRGTLEESIKRLENIVESLEQGEIPLEQAVELYEEAVRISRECGEKLKATELRIKRLTKDLGGQFELSDIGDS